jgi:hypothetical protein
LSFVFFTDRDLGNRFPDTLASAGLQVERHREHFRPDCPDDEWLAEVGLKGWIALTRDTRIRYKPNELAAVVRHRVRLLVLVGKASFPDLARNFVDTAPKIFHFLGEHQAPLIAKIYRSSPTILAKDPHAPGEVVRWYPKQ